MSNGDKVKRGDKLLTVAHSTVSGRHVNTREVTVSRVTDAYIYAGGNKFPRNEARHKIKEI